MNIPFIDLKAQLATIEHEVMPAMKSVLDNTAFILGQDVAAFEQEFAAYCTCDHAVGVASGLDALKLSLRALDVQPGDEVITAANTFIATTLAASAIGAKPVLVDIEPDSFNLDPKQLEAAITPKTKVLLPVHLYGRPADMDPIIRIAQKHQLHILEDASQAHGARYKGKRVGAFGDLAAFSLYPGKNLGAYGDGGIVTTQNDQLAAALKTLRNYGSSQKYYHDLLGENSRLDTLQATVLRIKLKHLDAWSQRRRQHAATYHEGLKNVGDLILPPEHPDFEPVYHLYVIRTQKRDDLMAYLQAHGVGCIIHYPIPIHLQKAYEGHGWVKGQFPVTEAIANEILSIPMFPELTEAQQQYVIQTIRNFFAEAASA